MPREMEIEQGAQPDAEARRPAQAASTWQLPPPWQFPQRGDGGVGAAWQPTQWGPQGAHNAAERVKLAPLWTSDVDNWFTLTESAFNRAGIAEARLKFDLVLPALSEETLERCRGVLRTVNSTADPYGDLKKRLRQIYAPEPVDLCLKILHSPELGARRPSQMLDGLLALLPPGEPDGLLFRTVFLTRLPDEIQDQVSAQAKVLTTVQLGELADSLWFARNQRLHGRKGKAGVSAVQEVEDLEEVVAALSVQPKRKQQSKKPARKGNKTAYFCHRHATYGPAAFSCDSPTTCQWSGNE